MGEGDYFLIELSESITALYRSPAVASPLPLTPCDAVRQTSLLVRVRHPPSSLLERRDFVFSDDQRHTQVSRRVCFLFPACPHWEHGHPRKQDGQ